MVVEQRHSGRNRGAHILIHKLKAEKEYTGDGMAESFKTSKPAPVTYLLLLYKQL